LIAYKKLSYKKAAADRARADGAETYRRCVAELIRLPEVRALRAFAQHGRTNRLRHSLRVSYYSYRVARALGWDCRAAARGGLLHDLFLYEWRDTELTALQHARQHPRSALENAQRLCALTPVERDIILKHMWPFPAKFPRYREAYIVAVMDTLCAAAEMMGRRA